MYLYDKRETLTVTDFNSVMFIHTTNVTNPMMVVCIFLNSEHLHAMICQLESAAFQPHSHKEYLYVYKWKSSGYFIKKMFYGVNGFLCTFGPILAMLQGKAAPLATYIPPWIHWRVYFWFQSTVSVYNATMASIYVSILCTLLIEAIIQVACLKERLESVEDRRCLEECIEHYSQITAFTKRIHNICKIGLTVVFVTGVLNICTSLSLILEVKFIELVFMVPYLSEMIMIIYIHCFYGTILANEVRKYYHLLSLQIDDSPFTKTSKLNLEVLQFAIK
ncbi:unnamed protein product [Acanthoscelides obtectus]|uniref:Uncharacterized protein n=1 Tax=Acanthoscelides obtectus TaxID=200917 RepID=A0A9P0NQF6_ACAOB|nr:unnamed protein product [Acanthoscelides obtectus]CAK1678440.1 hypothetical protein AOBTE_LOCUS31907 [Acanthoscelides obtectus]